MPADSLGQGEQSAIVVGLFEALRQRGSSLNTVLIEEPEMYLHPQAQRYFRNLLLDIVDSRQAQIVISTHSPVFADMTRFRSIRIVRKSDLGTSVGRVDKDQDIEFLDAQLEAAKLTQYFDAQSAELLFAEKVLLVEGHGDFLAAVQTAGKLGVDLDSKGLSIVDCGGKNAIPFYARACKALGIPFVILHDEDLYEGDELPTWKQKSNTAAPEQNAKIREAAGVEVEIFIVSPTLEHALGVGRNAGNKPMRVLESARGKALQELPASLVSAVRALVDSESAVVTPQDDDSE